MARTTKTTPAAGTVLPFNTANGAEYSVGKLALGDADSAEEMVGGAGPTTPGTLRTVTASDDPLIAQLGAANEAAPTTDTAAAGLNGRLQRIAQRLTSLIGGIGAGNDAAATDETSNAGLVALTKGLLRDLRARLGAVNDAAWSSGPGSINALLKTIATQAADTTTPSPVAVDVRGRATRAYAFPGVREAVTTASSAAVALPTLGATREVRIMASTRCWVRFGASGVATAAADANSLPLAADSPEVIELPAGVTHFRVIRDTADGFIALTPVA